MSCNWVWTSLWMLSNLHLLYWKKRHVTGRAEEIIPRPPPVPPTCETSNPLVWSWYRVCVCCFVLWFLMNQNLISTNQEEVTPLNVHITLEQIRECLIYFLSTRLCTFFPRFWSGLDELWCTPLHSNIVQGSPPSTPPPQKNPKW